jgi:hypothetical protein
MKLDSIVSDYISCSPLKIHKNGMQSVFVSHAGKPLVFQTDTVVVSPNEKDVSVACSDALTCTLRSVDAAILLCAQQRSKEWFGKELTPDAVVKLFKESVVDNVLVAKCIDTDVFDVQRRVHDMSFVHDNCRSVVVLQLLGVYFAKRKFGASWNVKQILASPRKPISGYAFDDDEVVPSI